MSTLLHRTLSAGLARRLAAASLVARETTAGLVRRIGEATVARRTLSASLAVAAQPPGLEHGWSLDFSLAQHAAYTAAL